MSYRFDFFASEFDADPFPVYKVLRDEHPCYWHEQTNIWMLTRFDDIMKGLNDWRTYSSKKGNLMEELPGRAGATLGTTDPPRHDRLRGLVQHAFMRRQVDALEQEVRQLCRDTLDRFKHKDEFDFVLEYASRVSVRSLFRFLGLPPGNEEEVRHHAVQVVQYDRSTGRRNATHLASFEWIREFAAETIAKRRGKPGSDLISQFSLAEIEGDRLDEREVLLTISTLLLAGVESVGGFLSVFAYNLASFGEARERVVADPGLLGQVIEESLRYNSSAQRFYRRLTTDVELHGQRMRAGDTVCFVYGSANRDERRFADPDRFDVDRNPRVHLGFGGGVHSCIGSAIGRLVTRTAMDEFHKAIPNYRLGTLPVSWLPSLNFRSPATLPLVKGN